MSLALKFSPKKRFDELRHPDYFVRGFDSHPPNEYLFNTTQSAVAQW